MATVASAALLLLAGCGEKAEVTAPDPVRPVKMIALQSGGLKQDVSLPGQIFPARQANMAFEVPGQMTDIFVVEGQEVSAGQLLAKLDPRDYQSALDAATAQFDNAKIEAERAQKLFAADATSKQRVDQAESNRQIAQATLEKAQKAVEDTSLVAPISGVVARVLVSDILNVQAKQDILILQDNSTLKVTVDIPETLSILADPNMTYEERTARANIRVSMTAMPDRSFPAAITEISLTADPVTRTYKGTLVMESPTDLNILPGMTATVTASLPKGPTPTAGAFNIPTMAVGSTEQGEPFIWIVSPSDMTVRRQTVKTGKLVGDNMEIFSSELSDGDLVVTSGISQLKVGQQVRKF